MEIMKTGPKLETSLSPGAAGPQPNNEQRDILMECDLIPFSNLALSGAFPLDRVAGGMSAHWLNCFRPPKAS